MKNKLDDYHRLPGCGGEDFTAARHYNVSVIEDDVNKLSHMFKKDGVFNRIVTLKPRKALIGGHSIKVIDKETGGLTSASIELRTAIHKYEESISLQSIMFDAFTWGRLYGGSVILIRATGTSSSPLFSSKRKFKLKELIALPKHEILVNYIEGTSTIESYMHVDSGTLYHPTRVIHINGTLCTRRELVKYGGFSVSVLNGVDNSLKQRDLFFEGIRELIRVMGTKTLSMSGLMELLGSGEEGFNVLKKRIRMMNVALSTDGLTPLDTDEKLERLQMDFVGIPEMMKINNEAIAVNSGYPSSVLFMKQNSGAKATGNNEFTLYHDDVRWFQQTEIRPILNKIHTMFFAETGEKYDSDQVFVAFNQLNHADPLQESISFHNLTDAYAKLITNGIVHVDEIRSTIGSVTSHELIEIDPQLGVPDINPKPDRDKSGITLPNIGIKASEL